MLPATVACRKTITMQARSSGDEVIQVHEDDKNLSGAQTLVPSKWGITIFLRVNWFWTSQFRPYSYSECRIGFYNHSDHSIESKLIRIISKKMLFLGQTVASALGGWFKDVRRPFWMWTNLSYLGSICRLSTNIHCFVYLNFYYLYACTKEILTISRDVNIH